VPRGSEQIDMQEGFARFTPAARSAVVACQEEARSAHSAVITAGHLTLGLLQVPAGLAARIIESRSLTERVRAAVLATLPTGTEESPALIPFDASAKKALELTFRHALRLADDAVGTQHILLALLEIEAGQGPLTSAGLDAAAVEAGLTQFGPTEDEEAV
jgi:ATP-dependent Clp protease ATP-binding subunit ClpA